jgi:16S rRNA (cytosine967-C5)-methyltransferase
LVERWLNELGREEAEALLAANNEAAPTVLRVNRLRIERDALVERLKEAGVAARPTSFARDGIVLEFGVDPETLPGYREGLFSVQGEASQLVCSLVGATPSGRVLDVCAGPGGKATYLGEMIGLGGLVVALDIERYGLRRLASEARRLGLKCIFACQADSVSAPLRQQESFDAVLVDAPCSGLGTLRQHPEIRWRRTAQDLETLAEKQLALLDASARWVRRGGTLVYATCTIARIENEAVVRRFLEHTPEFRIENAKDLVSPSARSFVDDAGALRTFPHRNGLDGFYAVRMRRE